MRPAARLPRSPQHITLPALGLAVAVLASSPAHADDGRSEAHDGFMIRLGLGPGFSSATLKQPVLGELELDASLDSAFHIDVALGYAVIENLIVHVEMFGGYLQAPDATLNGDDAGQLEGTQLNLYGYGFGVTYYIMPYNVYVAGSLGMARAVVQDNDEALEFEDASGTALQLMVGKEWWVSDNWGLGIAAQYYRIDMEYANNGELDANSYGLLFSATYN